LATEVPRDSIELKHSDAEEADANRAHLKNKRGITRKDRNARNGGLTSWKISKMV